MISDQSFWKEAIIEDEKNSQEKSATEYGRNAPREDFAESIMLYYLNYEEFLVKFPNRAKIIKGLIKQLDTLKENRDISQDDFKRIAIMPESMDVIDGVFKDIREALQTSEKEEGNVIETQK